MNLWKCFWANWFWPLLALLLLGLLQMLPGGKWRGIEQDVASRVEASFVENGIQGVDVITHDRGRDVLLKAKVASEDQKNNLIQLAEGVTDESGNKVARVVEWAGVVAKAQPEVKPQPEPKPDVVVLSDAQLDANVVDGKIVLSGVLANQAQVDAAVSSAYAKFGADNVTNNLTIGDNIKSLTGLSGLFGSMDLLNGSLSLQGNTVDLNGQVGSDATKSKVGSSVSNALGESFSVNNRLNVVLPEPEAPKVQLVCQTQLVELMSDSQIFFETSRADIKTESYELLNKIVSILQKCPDANVEVAGHTDSRGGENINLPLSQRRAESVVSFIAGKGIASNTLTAVGYGSSKPVADNGTEEGRALNRRIEFTIK